MNRTICYIPQVVGALGIKLKIAGTKRSRIAGIPRGTRSNSFFQLARSNRIPISGVGLRWTCNLSRPSNLTKLLNRNQLVQLPRCICRRRKTSESQTKGYIRENESIYLNLFMASLTLLLHFRNIQSSLFANYYLQCTLLAAYLIFQKN